MSIDYRRLREQIQIEELLRWIPWEASERHVHQLRGACPLCKPPGDETLLPGPRRPDRSFSVNTQRNIFRCFRCHQSGNALDLWAKFRNLTIYQAATEIQNRIADIHFTQPPKRT